MWARIGFRDSKTTNSFGYYSINVSFLIKTFIDNESYEDIVSFTITQDVLANKTAVFQVSTNSNQCERHVHIHVHVQVVTGCLFKQVTSYRHTFPSSGKFCYVLSTNGKSKFSSAIDLTHFSPYHIQSILMALNLYHSW